MSLDHGQSPVAPQDAPSPAVLRRQMRGKRAYLSGISAEQTVEAAYLRRGCTLLGKRVRVGPGEIDLVFRRENLLVCVEVKSSSSHTRALGSLGPAQLSRLMTSVECYRAAHPEVVSLDVRIDLATVDGSGRFRVVPNITL